MKFIFALIVTAVLDAVKMLKGIKVKLPIEFDVVFHVKP